MTSLQIRELRVTLIQTLNNSTLPLEAKRLVVAELLGELTEATDKEVERLMIQLQEESNEQDESNSECVQSDS